MNYQQYRNLAPHQKESRIKSAKQDEKYRSANPLGGKIFTQENFMKFYVQHHMKEEVLNLNTYRFPAKNIKALLFMFHGLNAHIGQGAHVAQYYAKNGIQVVGFDHRGFGKSQGEPGYIDSLQLHLQDSEQFVKKVKQIYPSNLPVFAMGLSMGGMTIYHLSLRNPQLFHGVILMAPALKHNLPWITNSFTKFISFIFPKSTKLLRPFGDRSNKNPKVVQDRLNDNLCFNKRASLSTMSMIVDVMSESEKTFQNFDTPMFIVQGGIDKLVNPQAAFLLYDKSKTKAQDKQLLFYQNMWHGIWQQDQIWQILQKTSQWINKRIK